MKQSKEYPYFNDGHFEYDNQTIYYTIDRKPSTKPLREKTSIQFNFFDKDGDNLGFFPAYYKKDKNTITFEDAEQAYKEKLKHEQEK